MAQKSKQTPKKKQQQQKKKPPPPIQMRQWVTCGATNGGASAETDCRPSAAKSCVAMVKEAVGL